MLSHFRRALAARREIAPRLDHGLDWLRVPAGVLAYRRGPLTVACNFQDRPVRLPLGGRLLLASNPRVTSRGRALELAPNSAGWLSSVAG